MFVTGIVLVAVMVSIVHSMLSGLTPMQSLLTPGVTVVQNQPKDSPKPDTSKDDSDTSNAEVQPQPEPAKKEKPEQPARRANNKPPSQPVRPVQPPTIPKPSGLINDVVDTVDGLVKAILPVEVCIKILVTIC